MKAISAEDFLKLSSQHPVIDVRTPAEFEHGLDILAKEWRFYRTALRAILLYQAFDLFGYDLQAVEVVVVFGQMHYSHADELDTLPAHLYDAVSHHYGAGVYAHDYLSQFGFVLAFLPS